MVHTVQIGLVFEHGIGYCRGVLRGIKRFAETRPHWVLLPVQPDPKAIRSLARVGPHGLISYADLEPVVRMLMGMQKPWVSVCGALPDMGLPRVGPDDAQIGRLAASHFLDRGIRHFGFIGQALHAGSFRRGAGFRRAVEGAGYSVAWYEERGPRQFDPTPDRRAFERFRRWALTLPKPVGVLGSYDILGLQIAEVCRQEGLRVPDDVAIVGVGNDDLVCELARPSLSSVATPAGPIGYEASAMLERLMAGARPPKEPVLLPPLGVVTRQSSDVLAIDDPEVAAAVSLIRRKGHEPIRVGDILREVLVSRRSLERKFRKILKRGMSQEIRHAHMERAKGLLGDTEISMQLVAERAGFSNSRHLCVVFRQETGMTPTAYRRQFREQP